MRTIGKLVDCFHSIDIGKLLMDLYMYIPTCIPIYLLVYVKLDIKKQFSYKKQT